LQPTPDTFQEEHVSDIAQDFLLFYHSAYILYTVDTLFFSPLIKVSKEYRSLQKHEKPWGVSKSSPFYNILLHIKAIP